MTKENILLKSNELAELLRTTTGYIRNQIYLGNEGETIPYSIKIGSRRLWAHEEVCRWLKEKREDNKK